MSLKFNCPGCGAELVVKYLKVGEMAKCWTCGTGVIVPQNALKGDFAETPLKSTQVRISYASSIDYGKNLKEIPPINVVRSIVLEKIINGAIASLILWGVINLGAWFLLGADTRQVLGGLPDSSGGVYFLMYGTALIGGGMLLSGLLGAVARHPIVGVLNGLGLLCVGLWNVLHDFIAVSVLRPYGYTVEGSSNIWVVLGIAQLIWGARQLTQVGNLGLKPHGVDDKLRREAVEKLEPLLSGSSDTEAGRLKFQITRTSFPLFTTKTEHYTVWLLEDKAVCVENDLNDLFEIDRRSIANESFHETRGEEPSSPSVFRIRLTDTKENERKIDIDGSSLSALKEWARTKP